MLFMTLYEMNGMGLFSMNFRQRQAEAGRGTQRHAEARRQSLSELRKACN